MKRSTLFHLCMVILFIACSKSEPKSYEYWNNLVSEKYEEINALVQSVPCTDIEAFEIIKRNGYYPVHFSVRKQFDRLQVELEQLQQERNIASSREGMLSDIGPRIPNHPLRKVCDSGKAKLIYVKDLSMEEIDSELPVRYKEIKAFYKDVRCTDASQWTGHYIFSDCKMEAIAVHKTDRHEEMLERIDIYNLMKMRKAASENLNCNKTSSNSVFSIKPVECRDEKPVVIEK
ncbi:hypothetical protein [Sphingobacterium paucimobilis]|nr:hypothetical protein [Sphingobacterium paucimobilis]